MEIKQNIAPYATAVKQIYAQYVAKSEIEYEYTLFQNGNLEKSFGCFDNNTLIGFVAVSEKTLQTEPQMYKAILLEDAMFDKAHISSDLKKKLLETAFNHFRPIVDTVCLHACNGDEVHASLDLEDTTIVHECEFIKGEYPTPMIMTWPDPKAELMLGIENVDGENRVGLERSLSQINLDIRCKQNNDLAFLANPFAYAGYNPTTKQIVQLSYYETAQATGLFNTIHPNGTFYLYANYDFNELPNIKVVKQNIVLVKTFKASKTILHNVKFLDL